MQPYRKLTPNLETPISSASSGRRLSFIPRQGLVHLARQSGVKVIEVNIEDTPVSRIVDLTWRAPATDALRMLSAV